MRLATRVEVFGLEHPIDWPEGTAVTVVEWNNNTATVLGPGGVVVTLPRRGAGRLTGDQTDDNAHDDHHRQVPTRVPGRVRGDVRG